MQCMIGRWIVIDFPFCPRQSFLGLGAEIRKMFCLQLNWMKNVIATLVNGICPMER
jgi:hypothetical protein